VTTPALRLRAALDALGWSQRELARRLVLDERTVRRWALGEYQCPEPVLRWLEDGANTIAAVTAAWLSEAPRPGRANASRRGPHTA
jgi:ribosome-binding protein aMBF1 (putative translation factor)